MVEQRKCARDGGRFNGPRVNCENVPCLPVVALVRVMDDPRQSPYLMVWREASSGRVWEIARVSAGTELGREVLGTEHVEIKRTNGNINQIHTIETSLPRYGGKARLVICPRCQMPRRALYPWRLNPSKPRAVFRSIWQCRECAGLRYASEGGALVFHPSTALGRLIEEVEGPRSSPRPAPWYPYIFTDPRDAEAILPVLII
jgi:hypothetical protein